MNVDTTRTMEGCVRTQMKSIRVRTINAFHKDKMHTQTTIRTPPTNKALGFRDTRQASEGACPGQTQGQQKIESGQTSRNFSTAEFE